MKRIAQIALISAMLLALTVLAFAGGQGGQPTGEKVVKIGCSVSMSGKMAPEGTNVKRGVELWEEFVNSKGGIKVGNDMYQVEVVYLSLIHI